MHDCFYHLEMAGKVIPLSVFESVFEIVILHTTYYFLDLILCATADQATSVQVCIIKSQNSQTELP